MGALLFDIPSRGEPHCWSLNTWKARLVLNYKGIPYKTQWVEYPEIAPTLESRGITPKPEGTAETPYAAPAVQMPDGRCVMDSLKIAEELELYQPSPTLHLQSPRLGSVRKALGLVWDALAPIILPRVPEMVLNPVSAEYFRRTRYKRFNMPLEELAQSDTAGEQAWTKVNEGLSRVREVLIEDQTGPYIMGSDPGMADFVLAGFWRFVQILDKEGDLFGRLMKWDENFPKHFGACEKWLAKDD